MNPAMVEGNLYAEFEREWSSGLRHAWLWNRLAVNASARQRRLHAVAGCRLLWDRYNDRLRRAVETAERYADGLAGPAELLAAHGEGYPWGLAADDERAYALALALYDDDTQTEAWSLSIGKTRGEAPPAPRLSLLYEIVGNPFCSLSQAGIDPTWLGWNDGALRKMAAAIYDTRAFARLILLADALEDAGCADAAILAHCRQPGEHVRGCWVVDALLSKS